MVKEGDHPLAAVRSGIEIVADQEARISLRDDVEIEGMGGLRVNRDLVFGACGLDAGAFASSRINPPLRGSP
jgi:hypothetical protein